MKQHSTAQHNNIFSDLAELAKQIEQHWTTIFQGIFDASVDYPHLDGEHFNALNVKFTAALDRLHSDLQSPTLILATTGTTSSGKSTIVNLLCGADLMPRMAQEMSAGVVYIHHSPDNKNHLKVHDTEGAKWECGEWHDLSDAEIRDKLTKVMDEFNKSKGINQPATPHIELTYPLACFNNPDLLALSSLPKSTQFKLMDLPGLRNAQDSTNTKVIENCKDALCLVAYNMEETDEMRRLELVDQVLGQVKNMGGSPARMLFVLNRIDVFRKDREWERYQSEHVTKTKSEISKILNKRLSEHSDISGNLTYSLLSSLPALHAQRIKTGVNDRIYAADELDSHFNSLISEDILLDLPRRTSVWNDHHFHRVSDAVWKNSYGAEFFTTLDHHIQAHFPTLVIPSIVQRFDKEASHAVGEIMRTCYSQLNSSKEKYGEACSALMRQNAELRQFLDQSKQILLEPFSQLIEGLKKNDIDLTLLLAIVAEDLAETEVFQGITADKLSPLASWRTELRENSIGILQGVKQSLDSGRRNFSNTQADRLSEREQQLLSMACEYYGMARKTNDESRFDEQLENFLSQISEVIFKSLGNQVNQENMRIRDTVELIMKYYLDYLQDGIKDIAPEWNLEIGLYVLNEIKMPEINLSSLEAEVETQYKTEYRTEYRNKTRTVRRWYSLWLIPESESYKEAYSQEYEVSYRCLPNSDSVYQNSKEQLSQELDLLVEPFYNMIHDYINELTETVIKEQNRVLLDFNTKLEQARQGHQNNHEKVVADWQPLYDQAKQFKEELSQFTDTRNYL
jgi:GTPase Era involved in 16S rRNA processing